MKKFRFRKLLVIFGILLLTACTSMSKEVKELDGKIFNGFKGGQILVLEQKEGFSKKAKLLFSGAGVINPNTNPEDIKEDAYKKSLPQEFNNPKIILFILLYVSISISVLCTINVFNNVFKFDADNEFAPIYT